MISRESSHAKELHKFYYYARRQSPLAWVRCSSASVCLLPAGSAAGSSAGIVFTHGRFGGFSPRMGRLVVPIKVKFGMEKRIIAQMARTTSITIGPLLHVKFHLDRSLGGGLRPPKLKKMGFYQYNCP